MLFSLNRKSLFTVYLSVLRPWMIMSCPNKQVELLTTSSGNGGRPDKCVSGSAHAGEYFVGKENLDIFRGFQFIYSKNVSSYREKCKIGALLPSPSLFFVCIDHSGYES